MNEVPSIEEARAALDLKESHISVTATPKEKEEKKRYCESIGLICRTCDRWWCFNHDDYKEVRKDERT